MSSDFARVRVEPLPLAAGDNPPPFHWGLPNQPDSPRRLYLRRLRVFAQVHGTGPDYRPNTDTGPMLDAVVSTGEPLSVVPRWCRRLHGFEPRVVWLTPEHVYSPEPRPASARPGFPGPEGPDGWYFRDRHRFRLGLIWVTVYDGENPPNRLAPRPVVARFLLDDPPDFPEPVFGLQWGVLTNRRLVRRTAGRETQFPFAPEDWWLTEHRYRFPDD